MKKVIILLISVILVSSTIYAAEFRPAVLKLSASNMIHYDFDGSQLSIPVTVSGTMAGTIFFVYTKDQADKIVGIKNGYIGWHYVNKVDTMIYMSSFTQLDVGKNTLTWGGRDMDGKVVPKGDYTYYIWGYDNISMKVLACSFIGMGAGSMGLEEVGPDGKPLAKPLIHQSDQRWLIGSDPLDNSFLETSAIVVPQGYARETMQALHPQDWSTVFIGVENKDESTNGVMKYQWVPNGEAVRDTKWGQDNGATLFSKGDSFGYRTGVNTDGSYLYKLENHVWGTVPDAPIHILDFDGTLVKEVQMPEWTKADDFEKGAGEYLNGGPQQFSERNGLLFLNAHYTCLKHAINPQRYLESGDLEDLTVWVNDNGDYINDRNFEADASKPWACFGGGRPHFYNIFADSHIFVCLPQYDLGAISFSIMGPDGFGIGHYAFAGETAGVKTGTIFVCYDSPYDGCYTDNASSTVTEEQGGLWFVGHDSIKGTLTSEVAVEEAPIAFSVDQNVPNPFNPSTTINFSITEAANVTIEVYNVAGQKIDMVAGDFMSAGSHSVTWDGSVFSAGVYFYTVKAGEFSKTMKMTLLK